MGLVDLKIRSNGIKYGYSKASNVFVKTRPYPVDTFSGTQKIAKEKTNFTTRIKAFLKRFSRRKINSESGLTPIKIPHKSDSKRIIYEKQTYNYIDCNNAKILKCHNPQTLKKAGLPMDKTVLNVSNFDYPFGSIAASTKLDDCIATGELLQCAGVAIVDKKNNIQTLIHCFPGHSKEDITKLLEHSVSRNKKDLKITVITGADDTCDMTISSIVDSLKQVAPDNKIKFANFSNDVSVSDRAVFLENGELTCCTNTELKNLPNKVVNPKDRVSYIVDSFNRKGWKHFSYSHLCSTFLQ